MIPKGSSSRRAKEAAAAQAAAAAAAAASTASVQVRILLDDGTSNILMRSVGTRSEPVSLFSCTKISLMKNSHNNLAFDDFLLSWRQCFYSYE